MANTYDPGDRGKRGEEWLIFLSEIVDEVQQVKKSECKDERKRVCAGVHEREKEREKRDRV